MLVYSLKNWIQATVFGIVLTFVLSAPIGYNESIFQSIETPSEVPDLENVLPASNTLSLESPSNNMLKNAEENLVNTEDENEDIFFTKDGGELRIAMDEWTKDVKKQIHDQDARDRINRNPTEGVASGGVKGEPISSASNHQNLPEELAHENKGLTEAINANEEEEVHELTSLESDIVVGNADCNFPGCLHYLIDSYRGVEDLESLPPPVATKTYNPPLSPIVPVIQTGPYDQDDYNKYHDYDSISLITIGAGREDRPSKPFKRNNFNYNSQTSGLEMDRVKNINDRKYADRNVDKQKELRFFSPSGEEIPVIGVHDW